MDILPQRRLPSLPWRRPAALLTTLAPQPGQPAPHETDSIPHASALPQAGDAEGALAVCTRILAAEPGDSKALLMSGIIASRRGQLPLAIDLMRRAVEADPDEPVACKRLAMTLQAAGRSDAAQAVLRAVVHRAPYRGFTWPAPASNSRRTSAPPLPR
ncbi:MAG: tetratricopeptide repeat protein [Nevskia sp.]|nr:tetratricopeptide repeat protein [Nevskia sp.]